MYHALELRFDCSTDDAIRRIWSGLAKKGLDSTMLELGARPHLSLAVYDGPALEDHAEECEAFFAAEPCVPVTFPSAGSFHGNEGVVFLAPVVTHELLGLHDRFHARFAHVRAAARTNYLPGSWVPHCTVGFKIRPPMLPAAFEFVRERLQPIQGLITHAGLIEFEAGSPTPARTRIEAALAGRSQVPPSGS